MVFCFAFCVLFSLMIFTSGTSSFAAAPKEGPQSESQTMPGGQI